VTDLHDRRIVVWTEHGALFLLVFYLFAHTMPRAWMRLNTDFPNYYLTAQLAREGVDTSRAYEWIWLQREKDHRGIDGSVIGLVPITPFSTLVLWPVATLPPLTAKHLWIIANFLFLIPLCRMLRFLTSLPYRRIALLFALSFPLHRNLLYGQFYIFLLLLIVAACWATVRGRNVLAGTLLAIAALCKVFPALLFLFFLRRRNWHALLSGAVTGSVALVLSIAFFGWSMHRTYFQEVLPWALRGEALPPYVAASASISSLLHLLFLQEPQWNPHPWHNSPLCYALLEPVLQILIFAPAVLLIRKGTLTAQRILLEWSAILTASLAISTSPASYDFVLLVLPVCVLASFLLQHQHYGWLILLLICYMGIGLPIAVPAHMTGPAVLLYMPRLLCTLAMLAGIYVALWSDPLPAHHVPDRMPFAWAAAMLAFAILSAFSTFHQQRAVRQEFAYRLPSTALLNATPHRFDEAVTSIAMTPRGYRIDPGGGDPSADQLSFIPGEGELLVEEASSPRSDIVHLGNSARNNASPLVIADAREPMLSLSGHDLAFVRDHQGRGQLMLRRSFLSDHLQIEALTPPDLNVYEASFLSNEQYAFSASQNGRPPILFLTDTTHRNAPLALGESRYPALSPDGNWMAYSHLNHGSWNLWLRNQHTGTIRRIADVPCNQIQSAWEADSRTLLYASDCGRGLWLTAVERRVVLP
jgi:hypothetical protein